GSATIAIELQPLPELRPVRIQLVFPAVGELFVDGEYLGTVPGSFELPIGTHTLEVRNDQAGRQDSRSVVIDERTDTLTFFRRE
ncbi:MAG: hypothetical protein KC561_19945, partial [Myxococcales bacterium]|nr:hypothetical protein [Myxococcales bacterium]